jgi:hypothetical protein
MCKKFEQRVHEMTTAEATLLRRMVKEESTGWGGDAEALHRIARKVQASFWTLHNIKIGRAKTVRPDLSDRIRNYFIDHLRGHAARLLQEAEIAAKGNNNNVDLSVLEGEIRALASRLEAAKSNKAGLK